MPYEVALNCWCLLNWEAMGIYLNSLGDAVEVGLLIVQLGCRILPCVTIWYLEHPWLSCICLVLEGGFQPDNGN